VIWELAREVRGGATGSPGARAMPTVDVAVVGGGPAGCAVAMALARLGAAVVVLERTDGGGNPVGESLPPSATPLLHRLGAWEAVAATAPLAIHANRSCWGADAIEERDFLRDPYGPGWRVDRTAFNRVLLAEAERAGATVLRSARVRAVEPEGSGWRVWLDDGGRAPAGTPSYPRTLLARFLVDATGRPARIARALGARRLRFDPLAAVVAVLPPADREPTVPSLSAPPSPPLPTTPSPLRSAPAPRHQPRADADAVPTTTSTTPAPSRLHADAAPSLAFPGPSPAAAHRTPSPPLSSPEPEGWATGRSTHAIKRPPFCPAPTDAGCQPVLTPFHDSSTLVEAVADGWWYTGLLPDGALVAACFADPAVVAAARARRPEGWSGLLQGAPATRERVEAFAPLTGVATVTAAGMARLDRAAETAAGGSAEGGAWLAVGDAAACHDPLTSHGIGSALHQGPHAAATILAHLDGDRTALPAWTARVAADHERCRAMLRAVYALERRWPDAPFWRARA
jgi:flavin-dependent dehydrogenase